MTRINIEDVLRYLQESPLVTGEVARSGRCQSGNYIEVEIPNHPRDIINIQFHLGKIVDVWVGARSNSNLHRD